MVDTPIPVKKSASPDWWMKGKGAGTELDPSEAYIIDTLVEAGVGDLTDAAASASVDEDTTSRSMIALLKGAKNLLIDAVGHLATLAGAIGSSAINEYNVTLAVVDTEYSQALPANCKGIEFVSRGGYPVRYAFTTGKVATPAGVYFTLKSNCSYENPATLNLSSKTIYFASDNAGDVVELIAWS